MSACFSNHSDKYYSLWQINLKSRICPLFQKNANFYHLVDDKVQTIAADNLKDAIEAQFTIYLQKDQYIATRIVDGVIQILNEQLQPKDQVMLTNGRMISDGLFNKDGTISDMGIYGGPQAK